MSRLHLERHRLGHSNWLRAAVLGANDGIVSTASLILGVAAAAQGTGAILIAGAAGLVAGAMSMAAGEYVSVSSQADAEKADIARERRELRDEPESERRELISIYIGRGLAPDLAEQVAEQLMAKDALGAHARDELGITELAQARPLQAAVASAASFAAGAALPLLLALLTPHYLLTMVLPAATLVFLALLGTAGARVGGAPLVAPTVRVVFWGAVAMAASAAIGAALGVVV